MSDALDAASELERTLALARQAQPDELSSTDARRMLRQAMLAGAARRHARELRRTWWMTGGGLVFAMAAAGALWIAQPHATRSNTYVVRSGAQNIAQSTPPATRLHLPSGDTLVAAAGAQFELAHMDASERTIALTGGSALFEVEPLQAGQVFAVVTPHARVRVHGTVFSVAVSHGRTSVRVYEGAVSVSDDAHAEVALRPGQSYASDDHALEPEVAPLLAEAREMVKQRDAERAATPASDPVADASVPAPSTPPPQTTTPASAEQPPPPANLCEARAWLNAGELQRALDAARDAPAASAEHAAWCVVEADALRSMGRHAEAAQAYMAAVASSSGSVRAQAGFKAAIEYLRELGDARSAVAALSLAGVDAQGSALRERGMLLRIEALRALGQPTEPIVHQYMTEFPSSAGAAQLGATPHQ